MVNSVDILAGKVVVTCGGRWRGLEQREVIFVRGQGATNWRYW